LHLEARRGAVLDEGDEGEMPEIEGQVHACSST